MTWRWLLAWTLALLAVAAKPGVAATLRDDVAAPVSIGSAGDALYDASGTLTINEVMRHGAFASPAVLPSFPEGYAPRTYWFRIVLTRALSTQPWTLRYSYKMTRVDIYGSKRGGYEHVAGGFDLGAHDDALAPGVLQLPEWALRGAPVYVRVATVVDPRALTIAPLSDAILSPMQRRSTAGFFIGFYLAIGAFNLLMFLRLRDRSLAFFAGFMILSALRTATSFGSLWQILPPLTFLQRELIFDSSALGACVVLAAFSVDFLKLAQRDRVGLVAVMAGTVAVLSIYISDFMPTTTVAWDWTLAVSLGFYGLLLLAGVRAYRQGIVAGRFFSIGISATIVGYLLNESSYALPRQDLWVYALDAGMCVQALVLALAVAENVQQSRTEHERLVMESHHLEQLAKRDGLTGVLNRRSFDELLDAAAGRMFVERRQLGILMLDIDHFKQFNDTQGHQRGDEALQQVAQACAACVRAGDVFARYGGEEFAAILESATTDDLQMIADRMVSAVNGLAIRGADGSALTISIGGASAHLRAPKGASEVLHLADDCLYAAKQGGRNRINLSSVHASA